MTSLPNDEFVGLVTSRDVVHVVDVRQRDDISSPARHRASNGQGFQLEWVRQWHHVTYTEYEQL